MRIWGGILHPVKIALNLVLKITSIPSTVQKARLQLLPFFVGCSDTYMDEYPAGMQEELQASEMAADCFDIPRRNVFANQTRPFPPRLPTWELEPGWWMKPMAAVHHQRVCGASQMSRKTCCRIMGKGIFDKMSIPEALFSGMAFWMGECYLWMRVRSHLHFSPSQKYSPVLKTDMSLTCKHMYR